MIIPTHLQREYNTVVLAGLLHDIGKFSGRRWKIKKSHPLVSVDFITETGIAEIVQKKGIEVALDLLLVLVQCHHENPKYFKPLLLVQKIDDKHQRALAYIGSKADTYSSQERDTEDTEKGEWYKRSRLYSLFSLANVYQGEKEPKYYQLNKFSLASMFPVNKDQVNTKDFSYDTLYNDFVSEIKSLDPENFTELYNGLWHTFKKFLWAAPSDTWRKKADISLFDHLSTTSAIAASLYLYHMDDLDENKIKKNTLEKFILVGGDLSGIQDFLFEIAQRNPRRLSQTLRGRSLLLSLLVEIASLKILNALKLPFSAKLMSSGGRFIILVPNREDVKETLKDLSNSIEEEFFKTFLGKLTLTINYSTAFRGHDFKYDKIKTIINEVNLGLMKRKLQKNMHVVRSTKHREIMDDAYRTLMENNGVCQFCGVYPRAEKDDEQSLCWVCRTSRILGKESISKKYVHFTEAGGETFNFMGIGITLSDSYMEGLLSYYISDDEKPADHRGSIPYLMANKLPDDEAGLIADSNEESDSICFYCKKNNLDDPEECPLEMRNIMRQSHLSFQCIASYTPFSNGGKGLDKLAVLKADIDNLGYIIQYGFDRLNKKETSRYSISRFTFLSRMIDAFFQGWLRELVKTKFPMIYTVYSGGDDLFLIGPWFQLLQFSREFQNKFTCFFASNPDITLSAGITVFAANGPVTVAAERAEEYLERSKDSPGKNRLTLFDTTVPWSSLDRLFEFQQFLDERLNLDNQISRINTAFIYRLFKYHRLFLRSEEGHVEGLRFHSLMNYDINRNIKITKNNEIINQNELHKLRPLYEAGDGQDKELMRYLKIPLYITLFKNRGGRKHG